MKVVVLSAYLIINKKEKEKENKHALLGLSAVELREKSKLVKLTTRFKVINL